MDPRGAVVSRPDRESFLACDHADLGRVVVLVTERDDRHAAGVRGREQPHTGATAQRRHQFGGARARGGEAGRRIAGATPAQRGGQAEQPRRVGGPGFEGARPFAGMLVERAAAARAALLLGRELDPGAHGDEADPRRRLQRLVATRHHDVGADVDRQRAGGLAGVEQRARSGGAGDCHARCRVDDRAGDVAGVIEREQGRGGFGNRGRYRRQSDPTLAIHGHDPQRATALADQRLQRPRDRTVRAGGRHHARAGREQRAQGEIEAFRRARAEGDLIGGDPAEAGDAFAGERDLGARRQMLRTFAAVGGHADGVEPAGHRVPHRGRLRPTRRGMVEVAVRGVHAPIHRS